MNFFEQQDRARKQTRLLVLAFGLAVVTMFIRLALASPSYLNALLGVGAAAYAVALTFAVNRVVSRATEPAAERPSP